MDNVGIDNGTRQAVAAAVRIALIHGEEAGVVALLNDNKCESRLVVLIQACASGTNLGNFTLQDFLELAFRDTITVEEDTFRLLTAGLVEALEQLLDHVAEISNDLSTVGLDTDGRGVARSTSIHACSNCGNGGTVHIARSRVGNVGTKDDGGALGDEGYLRWRQEQVHTTKLHVDLETDVSAVLLLGISDVLALDTLCRNTNDGVRDTLDLSIERNTSVGQNAENQLRSSLGSITGLQPGFLQGTINVTLRISVGDWRGAVDNVLNKHELTQLQWILYKLMYIPSLCQ